MSRRNFLDAGAAVSTFAVAQVPASAAAATPASPYDFAAIAARLARPAQHRQVFAAARVSDGLSLAQVEHVFDAYEHAYGEGPGTVHAALVFYSRGAGLGLRSEVWRKYGLAELLKGHGDTVGPGDGNPYEAQMNALALRGATYLVCDNALEGLSDILAKNHPEDGDAQAMHTMLRGMLFPGAFLVPAGVAALNQAQEAHFTLLVSAI